MRAALLFVVAALSACNAETAQSPARSAPAAQSGFAPSPWPAPPPPPQLPPPQQAPAPQTTAPGGGDLTSEGPDAPGPPRTEPDPDAPTRTIPLFNKTMTRPTIPGAPRMTAEAMANHVSGKMLVKCIIRKTGVIEHCKMLKGLPYMDAAVLAWLASVRAGPVTMDGAPIDAAVTIPFSFQLLSDANDKP